MITAIVLTCAGCTSVMQALEPLALHVVPKYLPRLICLAAIAKALHDQPGGCAFPVTDHVDMQVEPGKKVAIIGAGPMGLNALVRPLRLSKLCALLLAATKIPLFSFCWKADGRLSAYSISGLPGQA